MDLSAETLFAALVVSSLGLGFFMYGKKQARAPQLAVGIAMLVYPYFVTGPVLILGVGGALALLLVLALRLGW